ncbi:hypothetical protein GCM10010449_40370 [Streptomyces rectiviolaceus]|uniref:Uncharacterized protein n=1 Tax=Streptomyces rectiviolaceus TaxID=332591 RepID=A0ABP6MJU5_9ACTN
MTTGPQGQWEVITPQWQTRNWKQDRFRSARSGAQEYAGRSGDLSHAGAQVGPGLAVP